MEALNDPDLSSSGGKKKDGLFNPDDDKALMRLMDNLESLGGAGLEQRLNDSGSAGMVYEQDFERMLRSIGT
jgi:hypothetical protein